MPLPTAEHLLKRFFAVYAKFVARFWLPFLIVPLVVTALLSTGYLKIKDQRVTGAEYLYTPRNAPSFTEKAVLKEHWPLKPHEFLPGRSYDFQRYFFIFVLSERQCCYQADDFSAEVDCTSPGVDRRPCNLLNETLIDEMLLIDDLAANTSLTDRNGSEYSFGDCCLGWWSDCYRVGGANGVLRLLKFKDTFESRGVIISYPRANTKGTPIYLARIFGGVQTNASTGSIAYISAVRLTYFLRSDSELLDERSELWELEAETKMKPYVSGNGLRLEMMHSQSIDNGLKANWQRSKPTLILTFLILASFSSFCMLRWTPRTSGHCDCVDWVQSKPLVALGGLLTASLGFLSGIGFLRYLGVEYANVVTVVPFLIISIGVDDMFIMVAAWHSTSSQLAVESRLSQAMSEAAVAITITSLTDSLSFAIGGITTVPAVQNFCLHASVCVVFNYLYQITFFPALMAFSGLCEMQQRHSVFLWRRLTPSHQTRTRTVAATVDSPLGQAHKAISGISPPAEPRGITTRFIHQYCGSILLNKFSKLFVSLFYIAYLAVSIVGCTQLQEGLELDKLMANGDPTWKYLEVQRQYMGEGQQLEVTFSQAPDLIRNGTRQRVLQVAREFEQCPDYCIGEDGTQFWLREYVKYLEQTGSFLNDSRELWVDGVFHWVTRFSFYKLWSQDIAWINATDPGSRAIRAFRMRIGLARYTSPSDRLAAARVMRRLAAKYPEYNISSYVHYREVADQVDVILPNLMRNIFIALCCMTACSLLLIPNPICTIWIALTIVSIDTGVIGFLSWWNVNLDPISMITILMSIGFSVDFSAHITYGYVSAPSELEPEKKIISSMERLAWPVFQGALSTVLGVLGLVLANSYMVGVFVKTVVLVIAFGMLHALIFLPVTLSTFMPMFERLRQRCALVDRDRNKLCF